MLCLAYLQESEFSFCLFMEQTEPGQPGFPPLTVLQFRTVRFYLCSPPGEMSLIKHSLSSAGKAVFIGKSLLLWPVGSELGSSAGCRGDGQPFHWPGSLLYLDVVVWEECGYTGGKTCTRSVFVEVASATQACGPQPPSPLSLDGMYLELLLLQVLFPGLGEPLLCSIVHLLFTWTPKHQHVPAGTAASSQLWFPVTFSEVLSSRELEPSANS